MPGRRIHRGLHPCFSRFIVFRGPEGHDNVDVIIVDAGYHIVIDDRLQVDRLRLHIVHFQIDFFHQPQGSAVVSGKGQQALLHGILIGHKSQRFILLVIEQVVDIPFRNIQPAVRQS